MNHYEVCHPLTEKYLDMLRTNRVRSPISLLLSLSGSQKRRLIPACLTERTGGGLHQAGLQGMSVEMRIQNRVSFDHAPLSVESDSRLFPSRAMSVSHSALSLGKRKINSASISPSPRPPLLLSSVLLELNLNPLLLPTDLQTLPQRLLDLVRALRSSLLLDRREDTLLEL